MHKTAQCKQSIHYGQKVTKVTLFKLFLFVTFSSFEEVNNN